MRKISELDGDQYLSKYKKLQLLSLLSLFSLSLLPLGWSKATGNIQWHKQSGASVVSLSRKNGDALGLRQRLIKVGQRPLMIETEISHLTSGCALTLKWHLPQTGEEQKHFHHQVTVPQLGLRQLAKSISSQRWPNLKDQTGIFSFTTSLPQEAVLSDIEWYGCGWSVLREAHSKQSTFKKKPTLPNGAKSTPAQQMRALVKPKQLKENSLHVSRSRKQLILSSDRWAFSVVIEGSTIPKKLNEGWQWSATSETQHSPSLKISIVHASPKLTPIKVFKKSMKVADSSFDEWWNWIHFLSYQEGVIDGLGVHATTRAWSSLLTISVLEEQELKLLSAEWCEAALLGALRSLPAWPHVFRAYKRPVFPLDGRLSLPIALARYFFLHPQGIKRAEGFLRQKEKGFMLSSVIKRHLQDLISRASFFANRPSQKHLISVHNQEINHQTNQVLTYSYAESVGLMPRSLDSVGKLLNNDQIKATLGAPIGLALRAQKTQKVWKTKARGFFGRQIEVHEARTRLENWGRFLKLKDPETPALKVISDLKYFNARLNESVSQLNTYIALDLLWGQLDALNLQTLLNHTRPFPAGLVTGHGVITEHGLPFMSELSSQPSSLYTPHLGSGALWMIALNRQLKRKWPYKVIIRLEDARQAIWAGMKASRFGENALDPWQSSQLSALDSLALFINAPPKIEPKQGVNSRELP